MKLVKCTMHKLIRVKPLVSITTDKWRVCDVIAASLLVTIINYIIPAAASVARLVWTT